jgi:streptomycin 6-kinase
LVKDLPISHERGDLPTYGSWLEGIHGILTVMGGLDDVLFYLNKAMEFYEELKQRYTKSCLLDGNLQHYNLFLNKNGGFTVTDPQSVVNDPIMLTARFLLNETPNTLMDVTPNDESRIREMATIIGTITNVPAADVLKSMFIDTALSNCWTLDEYYHFPKREGLEETKKDVLKTCGFVYGLI